MARLARLREELARQMHLFSLEMKHEWQDLEDTWALLRSDLELAQSSVDRLCEELEDAYQHLSMRIQTRREFHRSNASFLHAY